MVQPINLIFRYLQNRARIQIWLYEQNNLRIEGHIIGFDEYMNLVLDDAFEVHIKNKTRKQLGRILLKGDNITLIQNVSGWKDWRAWFGMIYQRKRYCTPWRKTLVPATRQSYSGCWFDVRDIWERENLFLILFLSCVILLGNMDSLYMNVSIAKTISLSLYLVFAHMRLLHFCSSVYQT